MQRLAIFLVFFGVIAACDKPTTECSNVQSFTLGPKGGTFKYGQWTFKAKKGAFVVPTEFQVESCTEASKEYKIEHKFLGSKDNKIYTALISYSASQKYPPVAIEAPDGFGLTTDGVFTACINTDGTDKAKGLLVVNRASQFLSPDFENTPTDTENCFALNDVPEASAADDSGWLTTLVTAGESAYGSVANQLSNFVDIAKEKTGNILTKFASSCFACEKAGSIIVDKFTCRTLTSGLKSTACHAAIGVVTSGAGIAFSGVICKGILWAADKLQKKYFGKNDADACNEAIGIKSFSDGLKSEVCSLCNTYIPKFNCTDEATDDICPKV
ncbi:hypothetical protein JYT19_01210 [Sulfobacillus acidophilus]|uniref:Uncharacterized protein n=1 Tax=Sulfobacillus acidophilus TaxID=53633 RepID=A0ABS3AWR2_9FIRM|nr:hypothetical protein [Sulfobacillus acidophilus]